MIQQLTTEVKKTGVKVKKEFLLLDMIFRLNRGETIKDIRERYGWEKNRFNYYVRILKKADFIRLATRSSIAIYEVTPKGKNFYMGYMASLPRGSVRLHNVSFSYPIQAGGTLTPTKIWNLKGTVFNMVRRSDASIIWTEKTVQIKIGSLIGSDAFSLMDQAKTIADTLSRDLLSYGFVLGPGVLAQKPHFAVLDPVIDRVTDHIQYSSDTAKIDRSEGSGELEYFDPESVERYIRMPEIISRIAAHMEAQDLVLEGFSKNIQLHQAVLEGIKIAIQELTEGLRKLKNESGP